MTVKQWFLTIIIGDNCPVVAYSTGEYVKFLAINLIKRVVVVYLRSGRLRERVFETVQYSAKKQNGYLARVLSGRLREERNQE